jgi:branched-chain amino acid transport system permease protein
VLDIIVGGAILGALFSLIALGLNLQYGVTKILNVAHGEFVMLGAYMTYLFSSLVLGLNPFVSLLISALLVSIVGLVAQTAIFRRIVNISQSAGELEFRSLLASFGLVFVIQNVVRLTFGATPIGVPYLYETVSLLGEKFQLNMIVSAIVSVVIALIMYFVLRFTRIGQAMRAAVEEPIGAQLVGINIGRVHMLSFSIGALLSAVAGSLLIMIYTNITPYIGPEYTFIALSIIVLGGVGNYVGCMAGGFLIGYITYVLLKWEPLLRLVVVYMVLIIILVIRPKGLFGR